MGRNLGTVTVTGSMGDKVMLVLGLVLICCMTYSNGEIAMKTQKNELPKEKRKIVKLLLRNFPLEESASYHNLVEDDEAGQPIARGRSMTKYAPAYPYEETHISKLHKPVQKPEISKFEYALSTILLPPPKPAEPSVDEADVYYAPYMQSNFYDENLFENSEDNADVFYAPYLQNMYKYGESSYQSNEKLPQNTEDDADLYYEPYMQWIQNYNPQPLPERLEVYQDLPQHDTQNLYEGPVNDYITSEEKSSSNL